ncbi:polysaccharide pyruvyl transferase family protein [Virgibacillus byunsanensis]|uniref:Polysaccharide pyruvyl transferase family protein n=1 Tax=Virgibacillus byunsanensis TaxID=570945 RepID=A0ABW3LQF1_9BACI
MSTKRVLVNAYFAQNLGDDLFLKVLFDRYPNAEFHLLTKNENYNIIFQNYSNVKIMKSMSVKIGNHTFNFFSKLHDLIIKYKNYDALVNIGGSIFMESVGWQERLESRGDLPKKFKKINRKTYIIGANFGPFEDNLYIEKHKEFFSQFDDICFRDNYSHNIFKELDNVRYAPDVVFNMEINFDVQDKEKIIGFSIIDVENRKDLEKYFHSYMEKIKEIVKSYIQLGYKIKLFSFCEKEGDIKAINYLLDNIEHTYKRQIEVITYNLDINFFLDEYKSCEAIIATRFHSVVLSLLLDQNVFPIIYSDKTFNVIKDLNMESNCCYIKDIDKLNTKSLIEILKDNKLKDKNLISESEKQFQKLDLLFV